MSAPFKPYGLDNATNWRWKPYAQRMKMISQNTNYHFNHPDFILWELL